MARRPYDDRCEVLLGADSPAYRCDRRSWDPARIPPLQPVVAPIRLGLSIFATPGARSRGDLLSLALGTPAGA